MGVERTNDRVIVEASDQATIPGPSGGSSLPGQTGEPLQKFAMVAGDGEGSYSKNSNFQATMNKLPQLALYEALERVTLPSKGDAMILADLGSSSGPNAVNNAVLMVEKLRHRLQHDTEFQICFNDLSSNDFNTLFQHITNDPRAKNLFTSGVPGSYFGRLFPQSSVHVFYSANSLHWLSKIPNAALDQDSSAYGRGQPWARQSHSYQLQASLDLRNFLVARAAELVSGGLLFMVFGGRSAPEPNNPMENILDKFSVDLNEIWSDLVAEGLLTVQQQDTLNIPDYDRVIEDVREAMECCASLFSVLTTKLHRLDISAMELFATSEPTTLSIKMVGMHRAVLNSLFEAHVGKKVSEVTWQRYEKLIKKRAIMSPQDLRISKSLWVVSLIRK